MASVENRMDHKELSREMVWEAGRKGGPSLASHRGGGEKWRQVTHILNAKVMEFH
jgi:hypothetical protein